MASVTVLMFGKMDSGTRTCNQRIDQQGNDSRLLVEENTELKNMFEELQIEQKSTSKKLVQENTILENEVKKLSTKLEGLEEIKRTIGNLETKLEGLEGIKRSIGILETKFESLDEFQVEQKNTSKNLVQKITILENEVNKLQRTIGNLEVLEEIQSKIVHLETTFERLEELQGEQKNSSKKQEQISLEEFQSKIGNL